jgi:hypothetical protein
MCNPHHLNQFDIYENHNQTHVLSEHRCEWDDEHHRPQRISEWHCREHPYPSRQQILFDAEWVRDPVEEPLREPRAAGRPESAQQLPLFVRPVWVR